MTLSTLLAGGAPEESPSLVVLLESPEAEGLTEEACRAVRGGACLEGVPLVVLVTRHEVAHIEALCRAGASDFLEWPRDERHLAMRLTQALRRERGALERALQAGRESESRYRLMADNATEMKERLLLLQAAFEHSRESFCITDANLESPGPTILYVNPAFTTMTGYTEEEVVGRSPRILQGQKTDRTLLAELRRLLLAGQPFQGETVNYRKDGTEFWMEWQISPIRDSRGTITHYVASQRDVSERRRVQEALARSETMSAMGALLGGVAHEVRNPLFAMSAALDAFESRFGSREEYQRYLAILREELARMGHLLGELLEYGRPLSSELEAGPLEPVVVEAVRACQALASQRQVRVVCELAEALPPVLMLRPRLVQVFQNLIQNAVQHSRPEGRVFVRVKEAREAGRPVLHCSVRDEGPGFRPEDLPRLCEPFFSRRMRGVGLGLSIVLRIIEEHGGRITFTNHSEGGAVVTLVLPRAPSPPPPGKS